MTTSNEGEVLHWFERVLDQPPAERSAWLDTQALPDWLRLRVLRLVEAEAALDGFLEHPAAPPRPDGFPGPGESLGSYQLLERIDSGGMGVVYLARRADDAYEQQVAVKLIRPMHLGANAAFLAQLVSRFENERALLARLQHPNIARILDGGSTATGIPWLAMEYVPGHTLVSHCDLNGLDLDARLRLFRKVCEGVQEAHRHLIVHRDLKPENILVDDDGEPKLLDFGIARLLDAEAPPLTTTLIALTAMTPAYASPEQVRREPATTRSDVYSLGVMLYQLLAGARPYELDGLSPAQAERTVCDTRPRTLRQALRQAPIDPTERRRRLDRLDDDLERIVAMAMHKDTERRYGSAQELADDLLCHLEGHPVQAHPDSPMYRARKFIGRHRIGTVLASLALAAILAAVGLAGWHARQAEHAAADTRRVNDFLMQVLTLSDPGNTGNELTLGQVLEDTGASIDRHFVARPDLASNVRFTIGYAMLSHYRLGPAGEMLEKALVEAEAAYGRDHIHVARVLDGLAELRREQGRTEDAIALYRRGIDLVERNRLQSDPLYPGLLNNLGLVYLIEEDYARAGPYMERALAAMQDTGDGGHPADHAGVVGNLAQIAHGLEDYPRAESLYRQAQAELETIFPQGSLDIALLLNNRAILAEDRGDPETALALHRQSLEMRQRNFRGDHPMIAVALGNVARLSIDTGGDHGQALLMASDAADMADRVYVEPHPRHASIHAALGRARLHNADIEGAGRSLIRALDLLGAAPRVPGITRYVLDTREHYCARPGADRDACDPARLPGTDRPSP